MLNKIKQLLCRHEEMELYMYPQGEDILIQIKMTGIMYNSVVKKKGIEQVATNGMQLMTKLIK